MSKKSDIIKDLEVLVVTLVSCLLGDDEEKLLEVIRAKIRCKETKDIWNKVTEEI